MGLHPFFIGSSTILNNGETPNVLHIGITNNNLIPSADTNALKVNLEAKKSALHIWFIINDKQADDDANREWALASYDKFDADKLPVRVIDKNGNDDTDNWKITGDTSNTPGVQVIKNASLRGWKLIPQVDRTLSPGQTLRIQISEIVSDMPDGPSSAYFRADSKDGDFDEAWFSTIFGPVIKTHHVQRKNRIGIGTNDPAVTLDVRGGIRAKGGAPGPGGENNAGYTFSDKGDPDSGMSNSISGQIEFYLKSKEAMKLETVSVPKTGNQFRMDVSGGIRALSGGLGNFGDNNVGYFFKSADKKNINSGMTSSEKGRLEFYTRSNQIMKICNSNIGSNLPDKDPQTYLHIGSMGHKGMVSLKINGKNAIELGGEEEKHNMDNGKIGYQLFSNGLDIIGGGSNYGNRQVNLWGKLKTDNVSPFVFKKISVTKGTTADTGLSAKDYVAMVVGFSNESYDID
ncbi:MAG: hypothetical protein DWQ02_10945, partial [Bacteroidetes bacterium]